MSDALLTLDEIWARVQTFNRLFGEGTLEVYGLPKDFLKTEDAWEAILSNFDAFQRLIPQEVRSHYGVIRDMNAFLSGAEIEFSDLKGPFTKFLADQIEAQLKLRSPSVEIPGLQEKVEANPFGYFKLLEGLYRSSAAATGSGGAFLAPGRGRSFAWAGSAAPSSAFASGVSTRTPGASRQTGSFGRAGTGGGVRLLPPPGLSGAYPTRAPSVGSFSAGGRRTVARGMRATPGYAGVSFASWGEGGLPPAAGYGSAGGARTFLRSVTAADTEALFAGHRDLVEHLRRVVETESHSAAMEYLQTQLKEGRITPAEFAAMQAFLNTLAETGASVRQAAGFAEAPASAPGKAADVFTPAALGAPPAGGVPTPGLPRLREVFVSLPRPAPRPEGTTEVLVGGDGAAAPSLWTPPPLKAGCRTYSGPSVSPLRGAASSENLIPPPPRTWMSPSFGSVPRFAPQGRPRGAFAAPSIAPAVPHATPKAPGRMHITIKQEASKESILAALVSWLKSASRRAESAEYDEGQERER